MTDSLCPESPVLPAHKELFLGARSVKDYATSTSRNSAKVISFGLGNIRFPNSSERPRPRRTSSAGQVADEPEELPHPVWHFTGMISERAGEAVFTRFLVVSSAGVAGEDAEEGEFDVVVVVGPLRHPPKSPGTARRQTLSLQQRIEVVSVRQIQVFLTRYRHKEERSLSAANQLT